MKKLTLIIFSAAVTLIFSLQNLSAFTHYAHQNMPEDAFLYMELHGTNQQRWVADYMKAKIKGRTGSQSPPALCEDGNNVDGALDGMDIQCGALGVVRIAGIAPDFFVDAFWDDFTTFSWHFPDMGLFQNNYTSMGHFLNLTTQNDDGLNVITNNYNDYDGYSYNASYGFPGLGLDYGMAVLFNNSKMTIDLPNCTHENCAVKYNRHPNANPAIDYKQNGSTTPVSGQPSGNKRLEEEDGMNYNCFSDSFMNKCPDTGSKYGGEYQIPNTTPGDNSLLSGDEDWVIYEPADNLSTFYYNEMFLEGGTSRNYDPNSSGSLQKSAIVGRYYRDIGAEIIFMGIVNHWIGDMAQQSHVWNTLGYNHGPYEKYTDEEYGHRPRGGSTSKNWEDWALIEAFYNSRQNIYTSEVGNIDDVVTEQGFYTYHVRLRSGYDILSTDNKNVWQRAATWAMNHGAAGMATVFEKGILDLRKCRNSDACDNK